MIDFLLEALGHSNIIMTDSCVRDYVGDLLFEGPTDCLSDPINRTTNTF